MQAIQSVLELARSDLKKDDYPGATKLLKSVRRQVASAKQEDKAVYHHLMAKCHHESGQLKMASVRAALAAKIGRHVVDHLAYADMKYSLGSILIDHGNLERAFDELSEAQSYYQDLNDQINVALTLNKLARIPFLRGDLRRSYDYLELAYDLSRKHSDDKDHLYSFLNNMCRVKLLMGDFTNFDELLDRIPRSELTRQSAIQNQLLRVFASILRCDYGEAAALLGILKSEFEVDFSSENKIVFNEYAGLLEFSRGEYVKSLRYYENVIKMNGSTASASAQTLRAMVDLYVAMNDIGLAVQTARRASRAIKRVGERIELGGLLRAYGQIYAKVGKLGESRGYLRKSVEILSKTGAKYELAVTHLICGQSGSFSYSDRKQHLERSVALFRAMTIPERMKQARDAMNALQDSFISDGDVVIARKMKQDDTSKRTSLKPGKGVDTSVGFEHEKLVTPLRHAAHRQNRGSSNNLPLDGSVDPSKEERVRLASYGTWEVIDSIAKVSILGGLTGVSLFGNIYGAAILTLVGGWAGYTSARAIQRNQ